MEQYNANGKKQCMGCMEFYGMEYDVCPHCGYEDGRSAEALLHIDPGTVLVGRYIIGRALGYGGFGVTYMAWDTQLKRKLAIKEYLPSEFATRMIHQQDLIIASNEKKHQQYSDGMKKFLQEGQKLAQVSNVDGIVHMYDCFEANNTAYITMEYLEGETLAAFLEREGRVSEQEAMDFVIPVLQALEAVHEKGIIHRDIAPDNLFLARDANGDVKVKLIDFGSAKYATTSHSKSLTVIIKPGYSPEEQYRSNGDQGTYTDIYALAAVLYRMVTGVQPPDAFERRTAIEMKKKDLLEEPSRYNKELSANFENALLNAMNVRIEDRTATVADFEEELISFEPVKRRGSSIRRIDFNKWPLWAKIGVPLGSVAAIALLIWGLIVAFTDPETTYELPEGMTRVPDFVTTDFAQAQEWANEAVLLIGSTGTEYVPNAAGNVVLSQDVYSGAVVLENTKVSVVLSTGEEMYYLPDVIGMDAEYAMKALECMGLEVIVSPSEQVDGLAAGCVVSQDIKPYTEVKSGETITIVVTESAAEGSTWTDSSGTGSKTDTLGVTLTEKRKNYEYRCVVTDGKGNSIKSDAAGFKVHKELTIIAQPEKYVGSYGDNAVFSVKASGNELTYRWQYKENSDGKWKDATITGSDTDTISLKLTEKRKDYVFRCVITDASGNTVKSDSASFKVSKTLKVITQPEDYIGNYEDQASFTVRATGNDLTYQWQYKAEDDGEWEDSKGTGSDTNTLRVKLTKTRKDYRFRCIVTDADGNTVKSKSAGFKTSTKLKIVSQPEDYVGSYGGPATFTLKATGSGLTYQWQYRNVFKAPEMVGMTYEEALKAAAESGAVLRVTEKVFTDEHKENEILSQSVKKGKTLGKDNVIEVTMAVRMRQFSMPNLLYKPQETAIQLLKNIGIDAKTESTVSEIVVKDLVSDQSVEKEQTVSPGDKVTLTVSSGSQPFDMPKVAGKTEEEARKILTDVALIVNVEYDYSKKVAEGDVISQSVKAGKEVTRGTEVTITVCSTKDLITVADVADMTAEKAQVVLKESGLSVMVEEAYSKSDDEIGLVISQLPEAGSYQKKGATVVLTVSKGVKRTEVPDVMGMSRSAAIAALKNAGFGVATVDVYDSNDTKGKVISQSPEAGSKQKEGTEITLKVSLGAKSDATAQWSDWVKSLPNGVSSSAYQIDSKTQYRSRKRETKTSDQSQLSGWELYDTKTKWSDYSSWSDWSTTAVSEDDSTKVESKKQYRYSDKQTTTSTSSSLAGWTQSGSSTAWSDYGAWSSWSNTAATASDSRQVETRTAHPYYHYVCSSCGAKMPYNNNVLDGTCFTNLGGCGKTGTIPNSSFQVTYSTIPWGDATYWDYNKYYIFIDGVRWFNRTGHEENVTQYRYRDRSKITTYSYWKWGDWSSWSDTSYSASDTRQIDTRTVYRYCTRKRQYTYYYERFGDWSSWKDSSIQDSETVDVETRKLYRYKKK